MTKKIVLISDLHCGHRGGITPPQYHQDGYWGEIQKETWNWFSSTVKSLGQVDFVSVIGDAIDGNGAINLGVEQITTNRLDQVRMAEETLSEFNSERFGFIIGSPYHTGKTEDFEEILSNRMNGEFCEVHKQISVNSTIFDFKHVVGGTSIPYGKATAINKESVWATLKAERGLSDKPHVLARAHTHKFHFAGDTDGLRMTLPALQFSSLYGAKNFSGITDYGFVVFDVYGPNEYTWKPYILELSFAKRLTHEI